MSLNADADVVLSPDHHHSHIDVLCMADVANAAKTMTVSVEDSQQSQTPTANPPQPTSANNTSSTSTAAPHTFITVIHSAGAASSPTSALDDQQQQQQQQQRRGSVLMTNTNAASSASTTSTGSSINSLNAAAGSASNVSAAAQMVVVAAGSAVGMHGDDLAKLNVGGRRFLTSWSTLVGDEANGDNYFAALRRYEQAGGLQLKDEKGYLFIDRNPSYFEVVLDYLRSGRLDCPPHLSTDRVWDELDFFGLHNEPNPLDSLSDRAVRLLTHARLYKKMDDSLVQNAAVVEELKKVVFGTFTQLIEEDRPLQVQFWPAAATILAAAEPLVNRSPSRNPLQLELQLMQFLPDIPGIVKSDRLWAGLSAAKDALIHGMLAHHSLTITVEKCFMHIFILGNGSWHLSHVRLNHIHGGEGASSRSQLGRAQFEGYILTWQGARTSAPSGSVVRGGVSVSGSGEVGSSSVQVSPSGSFP
ncbi:hypothetical protein CAOG_07652 [Capsaspora owczarzaki ATCC 30864]|uniref:Potassium channel tetramerisation-type BTB domain-containing protein n=1 Tax=Capsaspora owczarzaki (strain ATCC 30864) TaxID=595528 RepID=A0A0D2X553_CAPO3|nr:hypothetical protein CAOG_07652 [Capsaspora owczarzaki ATCC 30864]KJE97209.1 hypothetical protein CAOG_007652 [Capsaspora owczarzaki ATCC 30864]|eukprot:XP_004343526.1 hypothetical protein CAOG_07652 [Capsaspora owczarzaki ATCC 30864]